MARRSLADWLERQERTHPSAIDLGLDRVREVARRLGVLPPRHRTITVGGTNGKGSTVVFVDSLLRAAGLRTGRFTSPHLSRYNERICIDGIEADDDALVDAFERIDAARGDITLTFFEYNALAALDLFTRAPVDVAVLEVGLGGRLDATNIVDADVAVVCSIGLDHVDWLGHTLAEIGREKAGIFRAGRPAVLGTRDMPASVLEAIDVVGAHGVLPGRDFHVTPHHERWDFRFGELRLGDLPMPAMSGRRQLGNAATALAAVASGDLGITLTREIVVEALREAHVRGRFQRVTREVEGGELEWVLDVAHNVPAAEELRANLATLPRRRTIAVCGILGDKDVGGITAALAPAIDEWILATLAGPRALPAAALAARLPAGSGVIAEVADVVEACREACRAARAGDRIVVFGSFLTVGPALEFLGL